MYLSSHIVADNRGIVEDMIKHGSGLLLSYSKET